MAESGSDHSEAVSRIVQVMLNQILYERHVYPKSAFSQAQEVYQVPVHLATHPDVKVYLDECAGKIKASLRARTLRQVVLQLQSASSHLALENFVFDFRYDQKVSGRLNKDCRQMLTSVLNCDSALDPIPSGCLFSVMLHVADDGATSSCWVDVTEEHSAEPNAFHMVPLNVLNAPGVQIRLYIEERKQKS